MTYEQREKIFSKDTISTHELQELLGLTSLSDASQKMSQIRRVVGDRLKIKGKIHTEDYFEFFGINTDRYSRKISNQ